MDNIVLALLLALVACIVASVSYHLGEAHSDRKHFQSMRETYSELVDIQREVGVTNEQLEKINNILAQKVASQFEGIIKKN